MKRIAIAAALAGCLAACGGSVPPPHPPETAATPVVIAVPAAAVAAAVARLSEGTGGVAGAATPAERAQLDSLYAGTATWWLDDQGLPTADARDALSLLGGRSHGLIPGDYGAELLARQAAGLADADATHEGRAAFDVGLSLATLRYWRDLHLGRVDPRTLGFLLSAPADRHDLALMLREALAGRRVREATEALAPPLAPYRALLDALATYRALAASEPPFPGIDATIRPADRADGVAVLRARLAALGDLDEGAPPPDATMYDGAIVDAVKRFQRRHGLHVDGVVGPKTAAALQVPLAARVHQLELSLERLRWLPHLDADGFLAVNIPMFRLWGWAGAAPDGAPAVEMEMIVGRALDTKTPVLTEHMRYLVFRPYWNVPRSIARGEILPALAADPGYLDRQDMEVVAGQSDDARVVPPTEENLQRVWEGSWRIRQRPGGKNALGLVKFAFPNREDIYMHGTPAPHLFGSARRDFSHGCVRVSDPVALALWVLRDRPEWTRERIVRAMEGPLPQRVELTRPIQVVLHYLTAAVMPDNGSVRFADDIYGHDARLTEALARRRP